MAGWREGGGWGLGTPSIPGAVAGALLRRGGKYCRSGGVEASHLNWLCYLEAKGRRRWAASCGRRNNIAQRVHA